MCGLPTKSVNAFVSIFSDDGMSWTPNLQTGAKHMFGKRNHRFAIDATARHKLCKLKEEREACAWHTQDMRQRVCHSLASFGLAFDGQTKKTKCSTHRSQIHSCNRISSKSERVNSSNASILHIEKAAGQSQRRLKRERDREMEEKTGRLNDVKTSTISSSSANVGAIFSQTEQTPLAHLYTLHPLCVVGTPRNSLQLYIGKLCARR